MKLKRNEKIEDLCLDNLKIIQNTELYRLTSDAVILANFIKAKPNDRLLDLGTGSGVIAILATYKNDLKSTVGVEIQPELAEMAQKSVFLNNLENRITIINQDMKSFKPENAFDVIVCNPPYKKQGSNRLSQNLSQQIARHEIKITLSEVCHAASKFLKFRGKFYICCDADRVAELIYYLKESKLEPKKMFFTQSSPKTTAQIVFIEAVKGGKEGIKVLPVLITNDINGHYLEIVKSYRFE